MNITGRQPFQKGQKPSQNRVLRNAPRDQFCKLAIPGVCRLDPDYTAGAHLRLPWLSGAAQKPDDLFLMDCCDKCHAAQEAFHGDPEAPTCLCWGCIPLTQLIQICRYQAVT